MASIAIPIISRGLLASAGKPVLSSVANKATSGILSGVGGAVAGKKGKKVGKAVARGLNSIRKNVFGLASGGKVRRIPGYAKGGRILAIRGKSNMINQPVPAVMGYKFKK